jgi:hypothetical protein
MLLNINLRSFYLVNLYFIHHCLTHHAGTFPG